MWKNFRIGVLTIVSMFAAGSAASGAEDLTKLTSDARQHYADVVHQADVDAAAQRAEAHKTLQTGLDAAMKSVMAAGKLEEANEVAALRKAIDDEANTIPQVESIKSVEARNAVQAYEAADKKTNDTQTARQAAACREYIAALDQLVKRALHDEDLAGANQINAIKTAAEFQLKVGIGRFPADPILLLTFDPDSVVQGAKPHIADQSGRGNDVGIDMPVKFVPAPFGTAIHLPGNKQLHSTQLVGISGHQPRTLSFWMNVENVPGGELHGFLSWGSGGNGGQFGAMVSNGHFTVWGWGSGYDFNTTAKVEAKAWHHHAITYDGTVATWYVDGKSIGNHRLNLDTVPAPLSMGGMDCLLSEVAIYDRALSVGEINQLGHHGRAPVAPSTPAAAPEVVAVVPPDVVVGKQPRVRNKSNKAGVTPPPIVASPPAPEIPIIGEFFNLADQAGLPQYLKCEQHLVGGPKGVRWGTVRTTETDFLEKDFVLDVVFALQLGDPRRDAIIGIGDNEDRSNPLVCHLTTDDNAGHAQMSAGRRETKRFADIKPDVPNLMRFEKKGDVLTISVTGEFNGKFRPDFSTTIPSIKSAAPQLNRLNSNLCFSGNCFFKAIRLEVEGKVIDPGPILAKFVEPPANEGWTKLEPGSALPPYLDGSSGVSIGKDGMELDHKVARTKTADYLTKDFTLDVVYAFRPDDGNEMRVGIGENGYDGGNWIVHSVTALLHGANGNGIVNYTFKDFYAAPELGKLGKEHLGPNLLRFQKRGDTLLISVCADYTDKYQPDFLVVIPSLKWQAPYLNDKNSALFIGMGGTVQRMRLIVDGKTVGGDAAPAVANTNPPPNAVAPGNPANAKPGELVSLAGTAGVPPFLHASAETLADAKGLTGGELRTAATDLIDHDFVFDLLFALAAERREFYVSLGQGIGEEAVAFRITGAGADGSAAISVPHQEWVGIGKVGEALGPHLLRIEKRGNTLTFSICAEYKDGFAPTFVRTIPDLKSAAPRLSRLNSAIYIHGNGSMRAIRLSIDGKDQGNASTTAATASSPTVLAPASKNPAAAPSVAPPVAVRIGPTGPENFFKLTGSKLPGYFETQHGLKYASDGLPLKDVHLRTRDADLIDKDFTFDIVFHFTAERETLMVGLGADEREGNWNHKSVVCRVESPPGGGYARIVMDGAPDATIGSFGDNRGPHLLRLYKHGNTLTFALCLDYKGTFKADFIKTLPDLRGVSPHLAAKNSRIFIGDGSVAEQTRLIVEGESIESNDIALDIPGKCLEMGTLHCVVFKKPGLSGSLQEPLVNGMALSPAGVLTWRPTHDQVGPHEFKIKITDNGQNIVQSASIEVVSLEDARAVGGDLSKVDSLYRLALESDKAKVFPGLGGTSLLVLDGQSLRQTGDDGVTVKNTWKLPGTYEFIGERKTYFVAMSDETKSLDLIDKTTMKVIRSMQMDYFRRHDLCLNPIRPISYVSVDKASGGGGFIQSVLVVDELTGDVREPNHFVGTFLKASPDGTRLYAAYKDIYTRGHELLFNPEHIDVVPVYGNIDILMIYDITRASQPVLIAAKNEAGANGQGLALSADGKRVSYLSFVGYPLYSKNISAWDPEDLTKRPVSYPTKANNADCKKLAFHPLLPIVAAPAEVGAVCFDRESGQFQPDRLTMPAGEAKVRDVIFSPDGKSLILQCEYQGDFFLRRVKLNLSEDELAKIKEGPPPIAPPPVPAENREPRLRT